MKRRLAILFLLAVAGSVAGQTYGLVSTFAGNGVPGYTDGPVASARFNKPGGVCTDPSTGTVYVADTYNHCIRKITGGMVSTLAGNGTSGDTDGQGANARFDQPEGLCFSNGWLYLTDSGNNKIKKIDTAGNVTTLAGTGTAGYLDGPAASAGFNHPSDVKVSSSGDIYIADCDNHCLRKISGGTVTTFAGVGGVPGDQIGPAASAKFNCPHGIYLAATGYVYIADMLNHQVKEVTPTGTVFSIAGTGTAGYQDGNGSIARFNQPLSIEADRYGDLLVADGLNNRIRRCTTVGIVSTVAGLGPVGYVDGASGSAEFYLPGGLALSNGQVFICDIYNHTIRSLDETDTGIPEETTALQLSAYPNPSADRVTVSAELAGTDAIESISIFSPAGALVGETRIALQQNVAEIYVGDLPAGTYEILLLSREGRRASATLVVK